VPLDNEEFETFFKHFDENNDDKISIKEFVTVIQPAIQKIDGSLAPK
jgi:Ca2+-binding EF-hand superfamily protein